MKKILIVSGHGGNPYDPGACGCGEKEAVLTRELAKLVQAELKTVQVHMRLQKKYVDIAVDFST